MQLPEKIKAKKIILVILIIIAIFVLIYEGCKNSRKEFNLNKEIQEQEIQSSNKEDFKENDINSNTNEDTLNKEEKERNLYNEAYTLFFSNEYEKSISKANELLENFHNSAKGYNIRGIAKSYNGSFEDGIEDINKALELDPHYGYAMFNKALTYELYNKLDEALIWYNKNLEVEEYAWTYYGMASIYGRRGDVQNTVTYLKKAIEIDSAVKKEAKTEADFNPVRGNKEFEELIK